MSAAGTPAAIRAGTFCWPELASRDREAALGFYGPLFGWRFVDDVTPAGTYTHALLGDREVGALRGLGAPGEAAAGPSFWLNYVAVPLVDAALDAVTGAGGQIVMGPYDAADNGRLAVVRDPSGATFAVWEAWKHPGAGVMGEAGALGWMQLNSSDLAAATAFYERAFGWSVRRDPMPQGGEYHIYAVDGVPFAGGMALPPGVEAPSHWLVYFAVDDVDAAHAKAVSLGATSYVKPMDIPGTARFAVLADPQGAAFAVLRFQK